jgi:hypothetical protein
LWVGGKSRLGFVVWFVILHGITSATCTIDSLASQAQKRVQLADTSPIEEKTCTIQFLKKA